MRILFFFLIFSCVSCAGLKDIERITFQKVHTGKKIKPVKTILMVGLGSSPTRFFLDNLGGKLSQELLKEGIVSEYHYLGVNEKPDVFQAILKEKKFDAVMDFVQNNKPEVNQTTEKISSGPELGNLSGYVRTLRYNQNFRLRLYDTDDNKNSIWEALLDVNIDFSKQKMYKYISDKIIRSLNKEKILI